MKNKTIETYIAYRLPNEKSPQLLKGIGRWISSLNEAESDGFIFHSFQGDKILYISDLKSISASNFNSYQTIDSSPIQTETNYHSNFNALKSEIESGRFKKVILSRTKTIETKRNALSIFELLNEKYTNTFNYVISNSELGTWIAATPELLLSAKGNNIKTMALAGTKTSEESWNEKEFEEQKLVTNTIVDNLKAAKCKSIKLDGPKTTQAGKIEHLLTNISAETNHKTDWIKVLKELHPTPAVCGIPTSEAKQYIPKLEGYNREFYTGFIGIMQQNRKDFFVNLRCMKLHKNGAKLYVGGGITAQSIGTAEWNETERKADTMASVLGE